VPLRLKLKVPASEVAIQKESEKLWKKVAQRLAERMASKQIGEAKLDEEAQNRQALAEASFPLEPGDKVQPNVAPKDEGAATAQNVDPDFEKSEYM
jgi:hypothetical protein